jgi:hypothetical protein
MTSLMLMVRNHVSQCCLASEDSPGGMPVSRGTQPVARPWQALPAARNDNAMPKKVPPNRFSCGDQGAGFKVWGVGLKV